MYENSGHQRPQYQHGGHSGAGHLWLRKLRNPLRRIDAAGKTYGVDIERYQSNYEGDIVTKIQQAYGVFDGIVINPAAYTHTSVAILDALKAVSIPAVEVHISDINQREPFRQISYPGMYCEKTIKGHGFAGYEEAIAYLAETYKK